MKVMFALDLSASIRFNINDVWQHKDVNMPLPIKSIALKQIEFLNIKAEVSANGTEEVNIINPDDSKQPAYYKACNNQKYLPMLAKYVVASSVLVRAALGKEASEEQLVLDSNNRVVGTISLPVPNFIPFSTLFSFSSHVNPEHQYYAVPDKKLLLKKNAAPIMFSNYYHKNMDPHPKNVSLNGLIDYDEFHFTITSILKYGKQQVIKLSKHDIEHFPNIPYGNRRHWFTYVIPASPNILKTYQSNAFSELEKEPDFIEQKYAAILKELLAFDKNALKKSMQCYLGEEKLNLHEIPKEKLKLLLQYDKELIEKRMQEENSKELKNISEQEYQKLFLEYQKKYSLFYDENGRELSCVEHFLRYFEEEYQELLQIMIDVDGFREFLIRANNQPHIIQDIKQWFKSQKKSNPDAPCHLPYINQLYHYIWRETFKKNIDAKYAAIEKLIQQFCRSENSVETFEYRLSKIRIPSPHKRDAKLGIADSLILVEKPKTLESKNTIADIYYREIKNEEKKFFQELIQIKEQYYQKPELSLKDNHEFIAEIEKLIDRAMKTRKAKKEWIHQNKESLKKAKNIDGPIDDLIFDMDDFYNELNTLSLQLNVSLKQFRLNEKTIFKTESPAPVSTVGEMKDLPLYSPKLYSSRTETDRGFKRLSLPPPTHTVPSPDTPTPHHPIPDPTDDDFQLVASYPKLIPDTISKRLSAWIDKNRFHVQTIIKDTYLKYKKSRYFTYFQTHGDETLTSSLEDVLSSGGWTSTSLNCLLIKELTLAMLGSIKDKDESEQFIYDNVKDKDNYWWSNIAEEIARKCNLVKEKPIEPQSNQYWGYFPFGK